MALEAGSRLGPYEVTSPLGEGGMGVVFRARDVKLQRDVALKLLPDRFANDSERLLRFQREAQLLAALNHPNIAQIYGLEESVDTRCIVMELVEGETLLERLKRGPMPTDEALPLANQIAEALDAAHERGIIHRDLKPGNIKLTPDGRVKVLDFGLAKIYESGAGASTNISNSPTLSAIQTAGGVILGTAAYMSPEQARGKNVDRRADVWAFGCVLYEMLTGKRAFDADEITDTLALIITKDPDWQKLSKDTPIGIRRLLRRCLEKDPRRRLRDIGDVQIEIEEAINHADSSVQSVTTSSRGPTSKLWFASAAFFLLTTVVLTAVLVYKHWSAEILVPVRFTISAPEKTIFDAGVGGGFVAVNGSGLSPDGRKIAFTARDETGKIILWLRSLDSLAAQALPGTDSSSSPFWSPDNRSIAFFVPGKLKKIDVEGGPPQTLCDAVNGRGGSWSKNGVIIFADNNNGPLMKVSSAVGEATPITKLLPQQGSHRYPSFLPDGEHFVYFAQGTAETSGIYIGSLQSPEVERLVSADSPAVYAAPGYLLFIRQGTLLAQPFDSKTRKLTGETIPIANQIAYDGPARSFAVSDNGTLSYRTGVGNSDLQLTWVDRTGKLIETVGVSGLYQGPDLSPDGRRIAVHRHEPSGGDVWIVETPGGKTSRFTFNASQENSQPIWSPDGTRIAFGSRRDRKWGIYIKPASSIGNEELLFESDLIKMPMGWSGDGKFIVYWVVDPKTLSDVWALPLTGERKPFPVLQTAFNETHPQISPDGKWIAYRSNESGRFEVYVQSFPPGAGKWQISTNGGEFMRWRHDGKELFYLQQANLGKMMAVTIEATGTKFESSAPQALFDSGYINNGFGHTGNWNTFVVSNDGQRFLIPRPESNAALLEANAPITIVLNWQAALPKK